MLLLSMYMGFTLYLVFRNESSWIQCRASVISPWCIKKIIADIYIYLVWIHFHKWMDRNKQTTRILQFHGCILSFQFMFVRNAHFGQIRTNVYKRGFFARRHLNYGQILRKYSPFRLWHCKMVGNIFILTERKAFTVI